MSSAVQLRDKFHAEVEAMVRGEMAFCPTILGHDTDVIEAIFFDLPDPESFEEAEDYLEAVRDNLDCSGYRIREDLEALFTGIIYTGDLHKFFEKNEDYCDDAVEEYGGFPEMMSDCESVSEVISRAAQVGADRMWRDYMGEIVMCLETILDRLDD